MVIHMKHRLKIYLFSLSLFLIDLISKLLFLKFDSLKNLKIIKGFFYFNYTSNTGGAFSVLSSFPLIFIIIGIIVLIILDRVFIKDDLPKLEYII